MHPSSFLGALVGVWRMVAELFSRPWFVFVASLVGSLCITFGPWFIKQVCSGRTARSPHHDSAFSHHSIATLGIQLSEGIVFAWWAKDEDLRHQRVAIRGPGGIEHLRRF